jgi:parvulin-like peptidyl-prolyl isomerase
MAKARPYARKKPSKLTSISAWHDFARNRFAYLLLAAIFGFGIIAYFGSGPGGGRGDLDRAARGAEPIALVNGEPITRADAERVLEMSSRNMGALGGTQAIQMQGGMLAQLVDSAIQISVAKKRGLSVSDAEIEKNIEQMKENFGPKGKPLSDDELDAILQQQAGATLAEYREEMRAKLLPNVLRDSIANKISVTEEDLLKSYDQVKLRHILIGVTTSPRPSKGALPDGQAKRLAEQILAKVKAGGDFAKLADQYTMDPTNKTSETDPKTKKTVTKMKGGSLAAGQDGWYQRGGGFVKEFEDAAFALKKGEVSGVVKTPFGYHIIKADDVRRNLPPDYAKNKPELLKNLKTERAQKPLTELFEAEKKTAKIEWKDPRYKWRYEYGLMNPMFGGMPNQEPPNKEAFLKELRAFTAKNPDDSAANLVLGQELYQQYRMAGFNIPGQKPMPKADRDKLRAEVIKAYENALKYSEDRPTRFALAELYEENQQRAKALDQYNRIKRLLSYDEGLETKAAHEQLLQAYKKVGETALATEEARKVAELTAQEKEKQRKEQEEAKKAAAASKSTPATGTSATTSTPLPGGKAGDGKAAEAKTGDKKDASTLKPETSGGGDKSSSAPKPR